MVRPTFDSDVGWGGRGLTRGTGIPSPSRPATVTFRHIPSPSRPATSPPGPDFLKEGKSRRSTVDPERPSGDKDAANAIGERSAPNCPLPKVKEFSLWIMRRAGCSPLASGQVRSRWLGIPRWFDHCLSNGAAASTPQVRTGSDRTGFRRFWPRLVRVSLLVRVFPFCPLAPGTVSAAASL